MSKMDKLEWYVVLPSAKCFKFNVFNSVRFRSCLMDIKHREKMSHRKSQEFNFKEEIRRALSYSFGGKAEYEIVVGELFGNKKYKIDVYEQVYQNFDQFYKYLIYNWDKVVCKSYTRQLNERKKGEKN